MSKQPANVVNPNEAAAVAARQASEQAVEQAREFASEAASVIRGLDSPRTTYLVALSLVVVVTLVCDIASFSVGTDGPVSETQAAAQRFAQSRLNAMSYSAFTSCIWGKLMWLSGLAGVGIVMWSSMTKSASAWVPLAEVGCALGVLLSMMLLWFVAFPDLSGYTDADISSTLMGYWLPLTASGVAVMVSGKRILRG